VNILVFSKIYCAVSICLGEVLRERSVFKLQVEVAKQLFIIHGVNHRAAGDCASCYRDRLPAISMNDYAALMLGVVCAGTGGELFVRGAVGLAHWARVSPGVIGATVAAFATSSSELSVSINAAIAEKP
jgi:hypothetical protein